MKVLNGLKEQNALESVSCSTNKITHGHELTEILYSTIIYFLKFASQFRIE